MGGSEAQSAGAVDVDALTTGNNDILIAFCQRAGLRVDLFSKRGITYQRVLGVDDGVVGTLGAVRHDVGAVGLAPAAEPELAASSSQRQEMNGRA